MFYYPTTTVWSTDLKIQEHNYETAQISLWKTNFMLHTNRTHFQPITDPLTERLTRCLLNQAFTQKVLTKQGYPMSDKNSQFAEKTEKIQQEEK